MRGDHSGKRTCHNLLKFAETASAAPGDPPIPAKNFELQPLSSTHHHVAVATNLPGLLLAVCGARWTYTRVLVVLEVSAFSIPPSLQDETQSQIQTRVFDLPGNETHTFARQSESDSNSHLNTQSICRLSC